MLPYGHQSIDEDDIAAVVEVLRSDWITQGSKVDEFESELAKYCGVKYAVAMSSGTAALHAACSIVGLKGFEAITTPITFAATANAVVYCGGKPVFADIKEDTLNIDIDEIKKNTTILTKAIIPVDFAGQPADLDDIMQIAHDNDCIVIEDACHALGAEYRGRKVGGIADMTVFSFHPVKHITTGEGGMVVTNNQRYYKRLKEFRSHGIVRGNRIGEPWYNPIVELGYNYRITDFQCALGTSQLNKLHRFILRRREIVERYDRAFANIDNIIIPVEKEHNGSAYHLYVVQFKIGRDEIFNKLKAKNIGVQVHYLPVHLHPFYQKTFGYKKGDYPIAERYYEQAITLPLFPSMSDGDVLDVIKTVEEVVKYYGD
jgi:UDP-4-amino-4,6-dideoxy-N-acetyl-beta-L-altrosamine transaminase